MTGWEEAAEVLSPGAGPPPAQIRLPGPVPGRRCTEAGRAPRAPGRFLHDVCVMGPLRKMLPSLCPEML